MVTNKLLRASPYHGVRVRIIAFSPAFPVHSFDCLCLNQQIILQSPRVLEQYNSTYISTDIVVQYRLYTCAIFHFKLVKH